MTYRAVVLSLFALLGATTPAVADERADRAQAAVEAFGKNARSFTAFKCKYIMAHGTAASLDDIKAGRYSVVEVVELATAVDGSKLRSSRQPLELPEGERGDAARAISRRRETCLRTGADTLVYDHAGAATLYRPDDNLAVGFNPLGMGLFDARLRDVPDGLGGAPRYRVFGGDVPSTDGRPAVGVRLVPGEPGAQVPVWRIALDPARGHLPCRVVCSMTRPDTGEQAVLCEVWLLDTRDCGRGRFFPTRFLFISYPHGNDPRFRVSEYKVTDLAVDCTLTREDLSVDLSTGTSVILSHPEGRSSVILAQNTSLHADDLTELVVGLEAQLPRKLDRARLRELAGRFGPWAAALVGGLVAIVLAQLWLVRRRRPQVRLHG
jgi:hypothetical protein